MADITTENNSIFDKLSIFGHQKVVYCSDVYTGLKVIIAIHDTTLGPALGGVRMWPYQTEAQALEDALRLSRGMTYKAAITGLNLGGGSAVIIGDSRTQKSEALMRRLGKVIENLKGSFIAAPDVGSNTRDMEFIGMETKFVTGVPETLGGSGESYSITAKGVLMGIKACVKQVFDNDSLTGRSVVVQGIGNVGESLVKLLREQNAKVYVSDINEDKLAQLAKKYGAEAVPSHNIFDLNADIYSPCALGATVNAETIQKMKFSIIAGSANNQLADEEENSRMLMEKGIVYAPDYLINAGGLIDYYSEIAGFSKKRTRQLAETIYDATRKVLKKSKEENISTTQAANKIAEKRIEDIRQVKSSF